MSLKMNPWVMSAATTQVYGGHTLVYRIGNPTWYLSNYMKFWRGSFNVTLKLAKTEFHSGRLLITWTPGRNITTTPTPVNSVYSLREVVDIRQQSEIVLNLPFMIPVEYLDCQDVNAYSGQLDVFVLNELRAPETAPQWITMLTYIQPGDDFELQGPSYNYTMTSVVVAGQSGKDVRVVPQSGMDVVVDSGIAEGEIKSADVTHSKRSVSEHFVSVKQLLNRFTQLVTNGNTNPLAGAKEATWFPWYQQFTTMDITTGVLSRPAYDGDAYSLIAPMYGFYRGSMKMGFAYDLNGRHMYTGLINGAFKASSGDDMFQLGTVRSGSTANPSAATSSTDISPPFITTINNDCNVGLLTASVPYQNFYPVSLTMPCDASTYPQYAAFAAPLSTLVVGSQDTFDNLVPTVYRACGDDFQFSFFIGAPPIMQTYV